MNRPLHLLIVEDCNFVRQAIKTYFDLPPSNVTYKEATTLKQAIDILKIEKFSAILLDLILPDAQDLEALIAINKMDLKTAIVVVTGSDDTIKEGEALKMGAEDYLTKNNLTAKNLNKAVRHAVIRNDVKQKYLELQQSFDVTEEVIKQMEKVENEFNKKCKEKS